MSIYQKIQKDRIEALKAKDIVRKDILGFLVSKLKNRAIELKVDELADSEVLSIIQKMCKELEDEKAGYLKVGMTERATNTSSQLDIVKDYLPKQLTEDEIKSVIETLTDKTMPSVMKYFKTNYAGQVDMSLVSKIARNV